MAGEGRTAGLFRKLIVQDDLLLEIIWGLMLTALFSIPAYYLAPEWTGLLTGCLAVALLVFWLIRVHGRKIWHYALTSFGLLTVALVVPLPIWPRLILVVLMLILAVRAFIRHFRSDENPVPVSLGSSVTVLIFLLALNLLAARLQMTVLCQLYFYLAIGYLLLTVWRWHQISLAERLQRFEGMTTQPIAHIRRFNQFLLIGFSGILLLVLIASPLLHIHDLFPFLGQLLLAGLRFLIKWLSSLGGDTAPVETSPTETTAPPDDSGLPEVGETPAWLMILQEIMTYLFMLASAALLLALLIYGIYTLYKRFYANRQKSTDVLESLLPNISDQVKSRIRRGNDLWSRQFGQSPEQRIRRLYYRLIAWHIHRGLDIAASMTPRQIEELLRRERSMDIREITELYELARYGPEHCSAETVRRMHELCRSCTVR